MIIFLAILIGCLLGALIGINAPIIPYSFSGYLAVAIVAALDTIFGALVGVTKKNFDIKIFVSGFFGNAILAILLTYLGEKLNVDIYLAAIVVFVGRIFTNLSLLRRELIDKYASKNLMSKAKKIIENKKSKIKDN